MNCPISSVYSKSVDGVRISPFFNIIPSIRGGEMRINMKINIIRKKYAALAAFVLAVGISGNTYADGVIYAPGVTVPGQTQTQQTGPGSTADGSQSNAPDAGQTTGATDQSGTTQPGSGADTDTQGAGQAQTTEQTASSPDSSAAVDIETLKAQSLQDQYTIFKTSDPNIVVSRGRTIDISKPLLALTYDDGPRTDVGARLMDVFEKYGQRTTFFMVGSRVPSRASELQRMVASGHEVANHTYDHVYLNKASADTIRKQVTSCNDIIEQTCGIRPRIMRLPGGNKNATVLANVAMPIILWNIDTRDWEHRNSQKTINAVIGKVKDGDIVLMHELYESTAAASEYLVPTLVEQGFQLVTVSELAAIKGKTLNNGEVYYSIK